VIVLAMSISALKLLGLTNTQLGIIVVAGTVALLGAFAIMRVRARRDEVHDASDTSDASFATS
jgi:glutamate/tyrosine decarboxylase-like PLP-dependent enzyme